MATKLFVPRQRCATSEVEVANTKKDLIVSGSTEASQDALRLGHPPLCEVGAVLG